MTESGWHEYTFLYTQLWLSSKLTLEIQLITLLNSYLQKYTISWTDVTSKWEEPQWAFHHSCSFSCCLYSYLIKKKKIIKNYSFVYSLNCVVFKPMNFYHLAWMQYLLTGYRNFVTEIILPMICSQLLKAYLMGLAIIGSHSAKKCDSNRNHFKHVSIDNFLFSCYIFQLDEQGQHTFCLEAHLNTESGCLCSCKLNYFSSCFAINRKWTWSLLRFHVGWVPSQISLKYQSTIWELHLIEVKNWSTSTVWMFRWVGGWI